MTDEERMEIKSLKYSQASSLKFVVLPHNIRILKYHYIQLYMLSVLHILTIGFLRRLVNKVYTGLLILYSKYLTEIVQK